MVVTGPLHRQIQISPEWNVPRNILKNNSNTLIKNDPAEAGFFIFLSRR
jgi:hypothetical protein